MPSIPEEGHLLILLGQSHGLIFPLRDTNTIREIGMEEKPIKKQKIRDTI